MKLDNIKPLDGVRAIAILLVLIWHYFDCQLTNISGGGIILKYLKLLTYATWSGVDLFFVLSGFLIGRILLSNKESTNYFKVFYLRRVFRIFPAYYLILISFFICFLCGLSPRFPWLMYTNGKFPFYPYLFYLQNFWAVSGGSPPNWLGVTWSLAVEEQFYLIIPLLIYAVKPKYIPTFFLIFIILAPIYRGLFQNIGSYILLPARIDSLSVGVIIAFFHLNGVVEKVFKQKEKLLLSLIIILFASLFIIRVREIGSVVIHSLFVTLYGIFLILVLILNKNNFLIKTLSSSLLSFIARISYMIYLTHQIFLGLLHQLILNELPQIHNYKGILVTLLALVITILFSTISYYAFEAPILSYGKKYNYKEVTC